MNEKELLEAFLIALNIQKAFRLPSCNELLKEDLQKLQAPAVYSTFFPEAPN